MPNMKLHLLVICFIIGSCNVRMIQATRDFTHPHHSEFKSTMIDPVPSHLKTPTHNHPDITHPHDMDDFPTPGGDISHEKIVHQLRAQGVSERNVESMAADIVRQHYSSGISIHNVDHTKKQVNKAKNYYDESHPMAGINTELVSSSLIKPYFKQIDRDVDGKIYIDEVRAFFKKEISITTVDLLRHRGLKNGAAPADFDGKKGDKAVADRLRVLKVTLENLDDDFGQVDHDKDGYLTMREFGHLIQMHTDQALRKSQTHLHQDMHEDFIHPSWKEDL
jgi:hypothetical protein